MRWVVYLSLGLSILLLGVGVSVGLWLAEARETVDASHNVAEGTSNFLAYFVYGLPLAVFSVYAYVGAIICFAVFLLACLIQLIRVIIRAIRGPQPQVSDQA